MILFIAGLIISKNKIIGSPGMLSCLITFMLIDFSATSKKINTIIGDGKRFMAYGIIKRLQESGRTDLLAQLEKGVTAKSKEKGKKHEVWEESFDWKICETAEFAYQKLMYMHNNPCSGKWKLVEVITKYEHSSARFYISGKHAAYEVTDVEEIIIKNRQSKSPESATHEAGL